ncbi:hypothetical protein [Kineococcus sp. SYSU DK001]|uniref:hypothetical protein n=1 Tax=Kineococcus sp. SYSU DK001 TaxID=3383122 RepID=UPI003D7E3B01
MTDHRAVVEAAPPAVPVRPASSSAAAAQEPVTVRTRPVLDDLRRVLQDRPTLAVSFDCFDTLLWRAVPKPTDVFLLIGRRLASLGLLRRGVTPELFSKLRVVAEHSARVRAGQRRGSTEVRLDEIYAFAGFTRHTHCTAAQLITHELAVEAEVTTADPGLLALLRDVVATTPARPLLVVSNTYLDEQQLRELLRHAGYDFLAGAHVLVSSEVGVPKADGLLAHALHRAGVPAAACLHVGNSEQDDVLNAAALGVATLHLPEFSALTEHAMTAEGWLSPRREASALLTGAAGDSGLAALRGRMHQFNPHDRADDRSVPWEVGATVLGPVFTGFSEWVHERAAELGIRHVLCLMREGAFLADILNGVPDRPGKVRAVPFWASRSACLRASFVTGDLDELSRVLWRPEPMSVRDVLDALDLRVEEVPGGQGFLDEVQGLGTAGDEAEVNQAFLSYVAKQDGLRRTVVERSARRRRAFLDYLRRCVPGIEGQTVGLVDLGFGGTIQEWLHQMVIAEGLPVDFHGFYLFTSARALGRHLGGHRMEGFLADAGSDHADGVVLNRSPEVLEILTTCSAGSLLEIAPDGTPVLAEPAETAQQRRAREAAQQAAGTFQRLWYEFSDTATLRHQVPLSDAPRTLHRVMDTFIAEPGLEVATALGGWDFEPNMGSTASNALVPCRVRDRVHHLSPEQLAATETETLNWVGAAAALTGTERAVALVQRGQAPVGAFLGDGVPATVLLTDPVGPAGEQLDVVLHVASGGNGVLEWNGSSTVRRVGVRLSGLGDRSAVLRLDGVDLVSSTGQHCRAGDESAPVTVQVEDGDGAVGPSAPVLRRSTTLWFSLPAGCPGTVTGFELRYGLLPV